MIIFFDWDGVIAKKEVSEQANFRRAETLGLEESEGWLKEAMKDHSHYKKNKEAIKKYTGIEDETFQTEVMTDLFKYHYLGVVNEWERDIFYKDVMEVLKDLKGRGNKLVIITGLVEDIIKFSLERLDLKDFFDGFYGSTSDLKKTKEMNAKEASKEIGKPDFFVGDRDKDLRAAKSVGAYAVYSTWGHGYAENEEIADHILNNPRGLLELLNKD